MAEGPAEACPNWRACTVICVNCEMSYFVHGATGAQGFPVLSALQAAGQPAVAAVRDTTTVPDGFASTAVNLADADSLAAAYTGAEGVFVHLPLGAPTDLEIYAKAVAAAVAAARPHRVVISTSGQIVDQPGTPLQAAPETPVVQLIRDLEASGVPTAVVAPRLYLEICYCPSSWGPYVRRGSCAIRCRRTSPCRGAPTWTSRTSSPGS